MKSKKSNYRPKNKLNKQINTLENSIMNSWREYLKLHEDLKKYCNRLIESDEEWEVASKIINDIQIKFMDEIAPALNYINAKHSFCTQVAEGYQLWIDTLKKAGLTQEVPREEPIIKA